jgi:hypothetical protein
MARELIIVMAQYDNPPPMPGGGECVGANDNASGVAVMLEAIRVLQASDYQPYRTLMFVAYSGEGLEGGEYVQEQNVARFLQARAGMSSFVPEAIIQLRGVGGGTSKRIEMASGGSMRLAALLNDAAKRSGARSRRASESIDMGLIYRDSSGAHQDGQDFPRVRISWEGWDLYSGLPEDTLSNVSAERLEKAGQTLALALMVLGREAEY